MACFYRADAQNNRPALIPAGGKLGVMSASPTIPWTQTNFALQLIPNVKYHCRYLICPLLSRRSTFALSVEGHGGVCPNQT